MGMCIRESGRGTLCREVELIPVRKVYVYNMNADGIAFHSTIISGPVQAIDFEFYDKNSSASLPTNL